MPPQQEKLPKFLLIGLLIVTMNQNKRQAYWRANTGLIRILLMIWGVVSLGCGILLVKPLNSINLGQIPLGFWIAQQGAIYVFVILIFVYAFQMDKLDRKYNINEEENDDS